MNCVALERSHLGTRKPHPVASSSTVAHHLRVRQSHLRAACVNPVSLADGGCPARSLMSTLSWGAAAVEWRRLRKLLRRTTRRMACSSGPLRVLRLQLGRDSYWVRDVTSVRRVSLAKCASTASSGSYKNRLEQQVEARRRRAVPVFSPRRRRSSPTGSYSSKRTRPAARGGGAFRLRSTENRAASRHQTSCHANTTRRTAR